MGDKFKLSPFTGRLDNAGPVQSAMESEKSKVSSNDTTADYHENKFAAGDAIVLTVLNEGGDEDLEIGVSFVSLSETDIASDDYLVFQDTSDSDNLKKVTFEDLNDTVVESIVTAEVDILTATSDYYVDEIMDIIVTDIDGNVVTAI
jgi:hypothetical protein